jgi:hypothetical protein
VYRFINTHLKNDPRPVEDSEADIVSEGSKPGPYPIPPAELRVFPTDQDVPSDQANTKIDEQFVPVASPAPGKHDEWKRGLLAQLRQTSFRYFPETIPAATRMAEAEGGVVRMRSEEGIEFRLRHATREKGSNDQNATLLVVLNEDEAGTTPDWVSRITAKNHTTVFCEPRGTGATKWTRKNPPNYVERSHVLLGRTVDTGRVWDVIAAARYLASTGLKSEVHVAGSRAAGVIAAYAAALDDKIAAVTLVSPPSTHMDNAAPQVLNVLRVCDIPDALGLLAPRAVTIVGVDAEKFDRASAAYSAANAKDRLTFTR